MTRKPLTIRLLNQPKKFGPIDHHTLAYWWFWYWNLERYLDRYALPPVCFAENEL